MVHIFILSILRYPIAAPTAHACHSHTQEIATLWSMGFGHCLDHFFPSTRKKSTCFLFLVRPAKRNALFFFSRPACHGSNRRPQNSPANSILVSVVCLPHTTGMMVIPMRMHARSCIVSQDNGSIHAKACAFRSNPMVVHQMSFGILNSFYCRHEMLLFAHDMEKGVLARRCFCRSTRGHALFATLIMMQQ